MKKYLSPTFFLLFFLNAFGEKRETIFHKHSLEFCFTPAFDHHFIVAPNRDPAISEYYKSHSKPLGGFETGLTYVYRPIRQLGFSTGLNMLLWGSRDPSVEVYYSQLPWHEYLGPETWVEGSFIIPLCVHFSIPLKKAGLEFITGPEFRVPIWYLQKGYLSFNTTNNSVNYSDKTRTGKYSPSSIRYDTDLCWSFQCGFNIPTKKKVNIFIGPELKLMNIAYFSHQFTSSRPEPKFIDYALGVKLGIRFAVGEKKKMPSNETAKSKS